MLFFPVFSHFPLPYLTFIYITFFPLVHSTDFILLCQHFRLMQPIFMLPSFVLFFLSPFPLSYLTFTFFSHSFPILIFFLLCQHFRLIQPLFMLPSLLLFSLSQYKRHICQHDFLYCHYFLLSPSPLFFILFFSRCSFLISPASLLHYASLVTSFFVIRLKFVVSHSLFSLLFPSLSVLSLLNLKFTCNVFFYLSPQSPHSFQSSFTPCVVSFLSYPPFYPSHSFHYVSNSI